MNDYEVFDLGDVVLREGATLRGAKLAYKTYGALNDEKTTPSSTRRGTRAGTGRTSG